MATPVSNDDAKGAQALDDAIHALAQPLTALMFLLELGALKTDPQDLHATLNDAHTECLRAVKALADVRGAAHVLKNDGESS